jgi:hypothetical protein
MVFGVTEGVAKEKPSFKGRKKYNLSICSLFTDEAKHSKEWIEYHRLVGVDHFYLYYCGNSEVPKGVLKSFIKSGIVTLIPWNVKTTANKDEDTCNWALSTQIPAYENAIHVRGASDTKWLVCLDMNEYLVPPIADRITDVLERYSEAPGVVLTSDCFDSSKMEAQPEKQLIVENTELISPPKENPNQEVTKTIFRPELCQGFVWPPYRCIFKTGHEATKIPRSELRINRYFYQGQLYLENLKRKFHIDNRILSEKEVSDLLKQGYEIEDQERAVQRFIPLLRKQMGLGNQWD